MFVTKTFNENHRFVLVVLPQSHGFTQEKEKKEEKNPFRNNTLIQI